MKGCAPTLVDARFAKPLDKDLLSKIIDGHQYILTIEEGSIGGFSSSVLNYVHNEKKTPTISTIKNIIFPDKFIEHNTPENQYKEIGMDSLSIADKVLSLLYSEVIPFRDYKKK